MSRSFEGRISLRQRRVDKHNILTQYIQGDQEKLEQQQDKIKKKLL